MKKHFPKRKSNQNKTSFGNLLVIAGSHGMEGAAKLSALAAARFGAGYVTVCSPSKSLHGQLPPDFLWTDWQTLKKIDLKKYRAVVFGPGLGRSSEIQHSLRCLMAHPNVVCDADGLFAISQEKNIKLPSSWILTPHAGELARMISWSAKEIEERRWLAGVEATKKFGCTVLLKGFRTIVSFPHKSQIFQAVITTGNVALAKAGTGDVLSGFVGALKCQGFTSWKAALTAASYHGYLADEWIRSGRSNASLMASDLISEDDKL